MSARKKQKKGPQAEEQQPAVLGGLGQAPEQAPGVGEPAVGNRERTAAFIVPSERYRHPGRTELVTRPCKRRMCALSQGDRLVELPAPPCRLAEAFQVGGGQALRIETGVGVVRCAPCLPCGGGACVVERVDHLRHGRSALLPSARVDANPGADIVICPRQARALACA